MGGLQFPDRNPKVMAEVLQRCVPEQLLEAAWVIANQYLVHLETMGRPVTEAAFHAGVQLVLSLFRPYIVGSQN